MFSHGFFPLQACLALKWKKLSANIQQGVLYAQKFRVNVKKPNPNESEETKYEARKSK